jgi:hypothetical protein
MAKGERGFDSLLFLHKLDVGQTLGSELDCLIEAVLHSVRDVDDLDDLCSQSRVKHVALVQVVLEIGGTGQDETGDIDLVVGDVVLHSQFGNFADIVVTFLISQTGETQGGLTTTAMLLWEVDREFVDDLAGVSSQSAKQRTVAVHLDMDNLSHEKSDM